jgi:hypothetical protein
MASRSVRGQVHLNRECSPESNGKFRATILMSVHSILRKICLMRAGGNRHVVPPVGFRMAHLRRRSAE